MEIKFKGTPKEVVKQMQDFLSTLNVEPNSQNDIPPFIELTDNQTDKVTVRELKEIFVKHNLNWLEFKRNNNLNIRRNNRGWYVTGIKIVDK